MGKLLERAIEEAHKLDADEQEAVGAWLLAEIDSERRWNDLFARSPSKDLERMAAEALEDHRSARTAPLDPDKLWSRTQIRRFANCLQLFLQRSGNKREQRIACSTAIRGTLA